MDLILFFYCWSKGPWHNDELGFAHLILKWLVKLIGAYDLQIVAT